MKKLSIDARQRSRNVDRIVRETEEGFIVKSERRIGNSFESYKHK